MDFEDIMPSEMSYKEKQISYNLTYTWNLEKKTKQRNNLELINTENRSMVSRGRESEKAWQPTPVLLPGKSHGQRSLVRCSPWGQEESDMTERLHFHFSLSCIGEGNGNPLQGSCLENPWDGGASWAAVYGAAQSRTQLK